MISIDSTSQSTEFTIVCTYIYIYVCLYIIYIESKLILIFAKVLYTTLIKGFARAGQVDQAVQIYEEMRKERSMQPDVITFSILIKANCDVGRRETRDQE